jgi:FkbM family methyltransferase
VVVAQTSGVVRFVWTHPANRGRRIRMLASATRFQLRGRILKRPTIVPLGRRSRIEVGLHDWGGSRAVYANPPDVPEMLVWDQRLKPGDLFVDVGANVGVYSVFAADLGAHVLAVEPGRVDRLERNVALNGQPIEIVNSAIADHNGFSPFEPTGDTVAHIGTGSASVPVVTLDDLLGDCTAAGVKVDVEGSERRVLAGAVKALSERRIACIQLEWNNASVQNFGEPRSLVADLLHEFGYSLYRPSASGVLESLVNPSPGPDVFALST